MTTREPMVGIDLGDRYTKVAFYISRRELVSPSSFKGIHIPFDWRICTQALQNINEAIQASSDALRTDKEESFTRK